MSSVPREGTNATFSKSGSEGKSRNHNLYVRHCSFCSSVNGLSGICVQSLAIKRAWRHHLRNDARRSSVHANSLSASFSISSLDVYHDAGGSKSLNAIKSTYHVLMIYIRTRYGCILLCAEDEPVEPDVPVNASRSTECVCDDSLLVVTLLLSDTLPLIVWLWPDPELLTRGYCAESNLVVLAGLKSQLLPSPPIRFM